MENNTNDIYNRIGQRIVDSIDDEWATAKLNITYIGAVKTVLEYENHGIVKNKGLVDSFKNMRDVKKLNEITTEGENNKWNKLIFSLKSDGDFDMEFTWDQVEQDEVESFTEK